MKPLLIAKTGTTLAQLRERRGDYEDWIVAGLGTSREAVHVVCVHLDEPLPEPRDVAAVVVTGSSAMVSDREPWSERAARWLAGAARAEIPILGICYGHQLLAHGLGGRVGRNPRGRQMGTVEVELLDASRGDPLLGALPTAIRMQATHVESVLELPPGARRLARNAADPNQAFAWGARAWGVQFHPEFDADVMRAYLVARREILREEGLDAERLEREVCESADGPALLRRFAELVAS